jgi:phosphoribosylformylglycinamidine synthase
MTPYEIMLSESQERMLLVVRRGREREVEAVFEKWDLHAVHIGDVTDDGMLRVKHEGHLVAEIPNRALTDEAPVYRRPMKRPDYLDEAQRLDLDALTDSASGSATLLRLLSSGNVASKHWLYRQYDHMVQTNTVNSPGVGAGVVRIKGTGRALAMSVDCNGRYGYLDPRQGARLAVAEASRNVACSGARPLATTNCLNFGNPEKPSIMWQFAEAVAGMGEACRALNVPVTGGNVSLYNETDGKAIYPTPTIAIVGLIDDVDGVQTRKFRRSGDVVLLLGEGRGELGGSEYLKVVHDTVRGTPPVLDLTAERSLQTLLVSLAGQRLVHSAHDCSDGGLAVALSECTFDTSGIGVEASIEGVFVSRQPRVNVAAALFGESASRVVVSAPPQNVTEVLQAAAKAGVPARVIGETGGNRLRIAVAGHIEVDVAIDEAERAWRDAIGNLFVRQVA